MHPNLVKISQYFLGAWYNAKVLTVDASLAKMVFDTDQRTEWIYRGSTRLGPLYNEAHKQLQAQNSAGPTPRRRHDLDKAGRGIKVNFVIESSSLCNILIMEIYHMGICSTRGFLLGIFDLGLNFLFDTHIGGSNFMTCGVQCQWEVGVNQRHSQNFIIYWAFIGPRVHTS